jgi:hypothetical protein
MGDVFLKIPVPGSQQFIAALAEKYFTSRLATHYRSLGYVCYEEYEYAGGTSVYPRSPSAGHTNLAIDRILRMLQGGEIGGFRGLPKRRRSTLVDAGHQKPDFMAFQATNGVVGEIGTVDMSIEKYNQLQTRLLALKALTAEEERIEGYRGLGRPAWHGPGWRAAEYFPEEGPVLIAVNPSQVISTAPTWQFHRNGVYLYALYKYDGHKLPVSVPIVVPQLSPDSVRQAQDVVNRFSTSPPTPAAQSSWLDNWPGLKKELIEIAKTAGVAIGVAALIFAIAAFAPATAAVAALAAIVAGTITASETQRTIA